MEREVYWLIPGITFVERYKQIFRRQHGTVKLYQDKSTNFSFYNTKFSCRVKDLNYEFWPGFLYYELIPSVQREGLLVNPITVMPWFLGRHVLPQRLVVFIIVSWLGKNIDLFIPSATHVIVFGTMKDSQKGRGFQIISNLISLYLEAKVHGISNNRAISTSSCGQ